MNKTKSIIITSSCLMALALILGFINSYFQSKILEIKTTLETTQSSLKKTQDSLNMYKQLPYVRITNPVNANESILLKNPQSQIAFDSSIKSIKKLSDSLINQKLGKEYFEKTSLQFELESNQENALIQKFKRNNKAFCDRWAKKLLDDEIGSFYVESDNEESFEDNPVYIKFQEELNNISNSQNDISYDSIHKEVRILEERDMLEAWNIFKEKNK